MIELHLEPMPDAVAASVHAHITAAIQEARPYLVTLTPHQRQSLPKAGDKSWAFTEKSHNYAKEDPALVPDYLDMGEFDKNIKIAHDTPPLLAISEKLTEALRDTLSVALSGSYSSGRVIYHNAQDRAKAGVLGAQVVVDDLGERFSQQGNKHHKKDEPTETE